MLRASYIGDAGAASGSSTPVQAEALAYFARMTTSPSTAYREAVNLAIYKWKRQGNWALLKGLWLFCAETDQAALLSVIGDAPRDATKIGTPTFVAGKGYEGISDTAGITWPITATLLVDNDFAAVFAGLANGNSYGLSITSDAGVVAGVPGHFGTVGFGTGGGGGGGAGQGFKGGRAEEPIVPLPLPSTGTTLTVCGGSKAAATLTPQGSTTRGTPTEGRSSNYRTVPASNALTRLTAIAYLGSAVTFPQTRQFLSTLNEMLSDLGALD